MSLLNVTRLSKSFGAVEALREVSFSLEAGQMLAMIGPNGAGKSTCFNVLNGQLAPDSGGASLDGTEIAGRRPREIWRMGVGRTFQIAATFMSMTARENVQVALMSHRRLLSGWWRPAASLLREEADALLDRVGMREQAGRACGVLAYGDLKRVELAVALANSPRLLLLDEPTAGMAPGERAVLMALVSAIVRERGLAALFTEHDMDTVFAHADRIVVLDHGRLIAEGSPAEVREHAEVRRVYLGAH